VGWQRPPQPHLGNTIDRRAFLKRSGLAVGTGAALSQLPFSMMGKAKAAENTRRRRNIEVEAYCLHALLGWLRDRRSCAERCVDTPGAGVRFADQTSVRIARKGASIREHGHGEHRLKYPMKLVDGKWKRATWDEALKEVSDKLLAIKKESGPTRLSGSALRSTTTSRPRFCASSYRFSARNNMDHQARSVIRPRSPASRTRGVMAR
jgi:formate dehydrogenase major subunit